MNNLIYMYVSSWNEHGGAPGLGFYTFDQEDGTFQFICRINDQNSFNGSCVDEARRKLYVNNEVPHFLGSPCMSGRIFVYDLDPETGMPAEYARIATNCPNPAYVSLDPSGEYLFEAHHSTPSPSGIVFHEKKPSGEFETRMVYMESDLQVYRLDADGIPQALVENIDMRKAQENHASHPHSAVFSPSGKLLAVADKGSGYLFLFTFDKETHQLHLLNKVLTDCPEASPRYVLFHPTLPYLYVNHEASYDGHCYITAFRYTEDGGLQRICVENVLDPELPVKTDTRLEQQGFVMHPDGSFFYSLINAADVIAAMKIDPETGAFTTIQNLKIPGCRPRGLAISPNGRYVISTCLVGGELTSYQIEENGLLTVKEQGKPQPGASYISFFKGKN